MVAAAVLLLPFRPLWSLGLFLLAYAIMFFGHFAFERNIPTILKHPSTPFVVAWSVIRQLCGGLVRLVTPASGPIKWMGGLHDPRRGSPWPPPPARSKDSASARPTTAAA